MVSKVGGFIQEGLNGFFFSYSSEKVVAIPRTKVALFYRFAQLVILAYIMIYIVWLKRGYQEFQEPRGSSVIKVKGLAQVQSQSTEGQAIWDTPEYQLPPLEQNALFIATRKLITYDQKEGTCPSALADQLNCTQDNVPPCIKDRATSNTFGYLTGKCVLSSQDNQTKVCEIRAWCPEENTNSEEYFVRIDDLVNFTIYVKTLINFNKFNEPLRNVRDNKNLSCRYNKDTDKLCPIFRIGDIFDQLAFNRTALILEGGVIEIVQNWNCNFDESPPNCDTEYSFNLLQSGEDVVSPGINYRTADKFEMNGVKYRILSKVSGLRFVITVTGTGGRFDIVNLFIAIGSGIGYMAIATFITECLFMYCHSYRERYRQEKVSNLEFFPNEKNLINDTSRTSQESRDVTEDKF